MARKKTGPKRPEAQAPSPAENDKLLEDLLGELMSEAAQLPAELLDAGPAEMPPLEGLEPELLAALAASNDAEPLAELAVEAVAVEGLEGSTEEAASAELLALQSAFAAELEAQFEASMEEQPVVESGDAPASLEAVAEMPAAEPVVELEVEQAVVVEAELALPSEETRVVAEPEPIAAAEEVPEPLATAVVEEPKPVAVIPRTLPVKREVDRAPAAEDDVLSQLVANIDAQIAATPRARVVEEAEEEAHTEAYASFRLAHTSYAVHAKRIREIDRASEITQVPNVPDFVRGVINLRGDITCVVDLRNFIGLEPLENEESGWLVVVSGEQTRRTLALLVDEMSSLVRVSAATLKPPAGRMDDRVTPLLEGVVEQRDKVLGVLSVDSLLGSPDIRQLWM